MSEQDIAVHELVAKIERGEIRIPEMQRRFVWKKTQVRDLLDSLYRKYPSGTILTWETDEEVATREFDINQDKPQRQPHSYQFLLDGQQRLTSLSSILRGKQVYVKGLKLPIDILFNLEHPDDIEEITEVSEDEETEDNTDLDADEDTIDASEDEILKQSNRMAFVVHSKNLAQLPQWVSVTSVFKETDDTPFLKEAGITSMDDPRYARYTDRLKRLRDIKDYKYRVHILGRDKSYEEVTEIFVRVNSRGTKLRSSDLALAQITAKWPGSWELFESFRKERAKDGMNLDLAIHIKNLVAFATNQSRFKIVGNLSKNRLDKGWEKAKEGMEYALNFLRSNVGIDNPALLSSPFIIITLAMHAYSKGYELSKEEKKQLRYWILVANTKARYSRGSSETFLDQDLSTISDNQSIDRLLQHIEGQAGHLNILPADLENKSSKSSYFKTMFLAFRKSGACDWSSNQLGISLKHSGEKYKLQFHHIFPKALLKKIGLSDQKINDICNMAFIGGATNRKISDKAPADYLPEVIEKIGADQLDKQCIPNNETLWKVEAYEDFLRERRSLVANRLNKFLEHDQ